MFALGCGGLSGWDTQTLALIESHRTTTYRIHFRCFYHLDRELRAPEIDPNPPGWAAVELDMTEPLFIASWTWSGPKVALRGTWFLILESDVRAWSTPLCNPQLTSLQLLYPPEYRAPWAVRNIVRMWDEHSEELGTTVLVLQDETGSVFTRWLHCTVPEVQSFPIWSSEAAPAWTPPPSMGRKKRR